MSDKVSHLKRSEIMSKIRSKGSIIEKAVFDNLKKQKIKFKKHDKSLFGCPDVVIENKKILIFVDSCFWHGCRYHCRIPSTNKTYWKNKIQRNKIRDRLVNEHYEMTDWKIIRIWEHKLNSSVPAIFANISKSG